MMLVMMLVTRIYGGVMFLAGSLVYRVQYELCMYYVVCMYASLCTICMYRMAIIAMYGTLECIVLQYGVVLLTYEVVVVYNHYY